MALLLLWATILLISIISRVRSLYVLLVWGFFVIPIVMFFIALEKIFSWVKKKENIVYHHLLLDELEDQLTLSTRDNSVPKDMYYYMQHNEENKVKAFISTLFKQRFYWVIVPIIVCTVPLILTIEQMSRVMRFIVPLMGRFGTISINRDFLVASIVSISSAIATITFLPNLHKGGNFGKMVIVFVLGTVAVIITAMVRQPYTSEYPKRVYIRQGSSTHSRQSRSQLASVPTVLQQVNQTSGIKIYVNDGISFEKEMQLFAQRMPVSNVFCTTTFCALDDIYNGNNTYIGPVSVSVSNATFTLVFDHPTSFNIGVTSSHSVALNSQDINSQQGKHFSGVQITKFGIASNQTIIDVISSDSRPIVITLESYLCDKHNSKFLVALQQHVDYVQGLGTGTCTMVKQSVTVTID
jgi:hypothetical protein